MGRAGGKKQANLVEILPAFARITGAGNFDVLDGEFIIIRQFLAPQDLSQSEYDYVLLPRNFDDARIAIGL